MHSVRSAVSKIVACVLVGLPLCMPAWGDVAQPENLGEIKLRLVQYQESGQYAADLAATVAEAKQYLQQRASGIDKPAIALDIDETSLSNWQFLKLNDFGFIIQGSCELRRGPCGFLAWAEMAKGTAIAPTLELYRMARERGVAVFFITGRPESLRAATERNLREAGYTDWETLYLKPQDLKVSGAAQYKAPIRCELSAKGYTIVVNLGDQASDLDGGCADRAFKMPNPYYRIP
jgi:acid phosphatase